MFLLALPEWIQWFNYPGLEAWKFLNLAIFTGLAIYGLRRRISDALAQRRDAIRQELIDAMQAREQALAKVADADSLLSRLRADIQTVREHAGQEVESERERVAAATAREMEKLKQQAEREMETADKVARKRLRRFFAVKSIEVARDRVRAHMKPEDDLVLIRESIGELRRTRV